LPEIDGTEYSTLQMMCRCSADEDSVTDKPKIIGDKGLYGMKKGYYSTPSETSAIKEGSN
jgi:hypothetical protein